MKKIAKSDKFVIASSAPRLIFNALFQHHLHHHANQTKRDTSAGHIFIVCHYKNNIYSRHMLQYSIRFPSLVCASIERRACAISLWKMLVTCAIQPPPQNRKGSAEASANEGLSVRIDRCWCASPLCFCPVAPGWAHATCLIYGGLPLRWVDCYRRVAHPPTRGWTGW